jgi:tRNA U54 and U55 pseudouridine synthase Pus10
MPHAPRLRCAGCNKVVENSRRITNNLLRLFLSARTQKKLDPTCYVCEGCRSKFHKWYRKVKDEVDQLILDQSSKENHDEPEEVISSVIIFPENTFFF